MALKEHKDLLKFLEPHLASLPSITFTLPAEDLASLALSSAILFKNANEKHERTLKAHFLPKSIPRTDFKLQATNKLRKKPEFKALETKVDNQVAIFQNFLKDAILESQKMEINESRSHLQKTTIHYSLLLSNHLVRFYKTLYDRTTFSDSLQCSDENVLSQDAIRTIFTGNLNEFIIEKTVPSMDSFFDNNSLYGEHVIENAENKRKASIIKNKDLHSKFYATLTLKQLTN